MFFNGDEVIMSYIHFVFWIAAYDDFTGSRNVASLIKTINYIQLTNDKKVTMGCKIVTDIYTQPELST